MYERQGPDICEMYSQPRIAQEAAMSEYEGTRLKPGWSLDLTRDDPKTGKPWDLGDSGVRDRVRELIRKTKPMLVFGSPPCTAFSNLQGLSKNRRDPAVVKREIDEAVGHLNFCVEVYQMQMAAGRLFVHEHPHSASSWTRPEITQLVMAPGVDMVTMDMCAFGMMSEDEIGKAPAKKTTRLLSNSPEILKRVNKRCANGDPNREHEHHRHVSLVSGRAKACQVYPRAFCRAVCEGAGAEVRLRSLGLKARDLLSVDEIMGATGGTTDDPSRELHEDDRREAFDDTSGAPLVPAMVAAARREEIEYFKQMKVYRKVHRDECWKATGKGPIQVRWVDINKGDDAHPNYRSRLVAKEFKTDVRPDLYAPTPPGECLRLMLNQLASRKGAKLMYADVSRAYFYAKAVRPVYVVLPPEDTEDGDEQMCGELIMSMYGTRDAALNWSAEYSEALIKSGDVQGRSNACLFHNAKLEVSVMVHGDDFVAVGSDKGLADARSTLESRYKLKVELLGNGPGCVSEVSILNKVVRHTPQGIELEADPPHSELVVRELGLEHAKPGRTAGIKEIKKKDANHDDDSRCRMGIQLLSEEEIIAGHAEGPRTEHMSPIKNSVEIIKSSVQVSDKVTVIGHGPGLVRGIGCCEHGRNKIHVEYEDGTCHHCSLGQLESLPTPHAGMSVQEEIRQPIMSAQMPEIESDGADVDDGDAPL